MGALLRTVARRYFVPSQDICVACEELEDAALFEQNLAVVATVVYSCAVLCPQAETDEPRLKSSSSAQADW